MQMLMLELAAKQSFQNAVREEQVILREKFREVEAEHHRRDQLYNSDLSEMEAPKLESVIPLILRSDSMLVVRKSIEARSKVHDESNAMLQPARAA